MKGPHGLPSHPIRAVSVSAVNPLVEPGWREFGRGELEALQDCLQRHNHALPLSEVRRLGIALDKPSLPLSVCWGKGAAGSIALALNHAHCHGTWASASAWPVECWPGAPKLSHCLR